MQNFFQNVVGKHLKLMLPLFMFAFSQPCVEAHETSRTDVVNCDANQCSVEIEYVDFTPWDSGDDAGLWCLPGSRCTYSFPTDPSGAEIYDDLSQLVHKPQYPSKYDPEEWKTVMMHMRVLLPMTACDYRKVLNFMQNKPDTVKKKVNHHQEKDTTSAVNSKNENSATDHVGEIAAADAKEKGANASDELEAAVGPVSKLDTEFAMAAPAGAGFMSKVNHVFTGYIDLDYSSPTSSYFADFNGNRSFSYTLATIWLARYADSLLVATKVGFYNFGQETKVILPYTYCAYLYNDYLTLQFGKIIVPFGVYYSLYFPGWIEKSATPPLGRALPDAFAITPCSDIGIELKGAIPLCGLGPNFYNSSFTYDGWIGNGLSEINPFSPPFPDGAIEYFTPGNIYYSIGEGNSPNNNSEFTFGGRLGFLPTDLQCYGISYTRGRWNSDKQDFGGIVNGVQTELRTKSLIFQGAVFDWNINITPYTVFRGEYIWTQYENNYKVISEIIGTPVHHWITTNSYWAQLSFNLGIFRCACPELYCWKPCFWDASEIVFRSDAVWSKANGNNIVHGFGGFDYSGFAKKRFCVTYGYYFTQSFSFKAEYAYNYGQTGFNPFREFITGKHKRTGFDKDVVTVRLAYGW